ncbi:MAG: recombination factor protein RarA [Gammaproteobacteria bacterium]|jgi:putative ATPase|nr:recombination factor protein RarA [Gammaproteobacteria bacterium]
MSPLAARLRPQNLDEFIGQKHLLGSGKALRQSIEQGTLHSMVFWGPPGVGKTTLAKLFANLTEADFITLSAVTAGVKEIRQVVEVAKQNLAASKKTIVFIDEIHRFNKSQQDALLPDVESGTFILIGATTENPSFELNNALMSRLRLYVLKALSTEDLITVINRALQDPRGLAHKQFIFPDDLKKHLATAADGDARKLLNLLEMLSDLVAEGETVTPELLKEVISTPTFRFDKQGEYFYDLISALHKSIRGSDPDAALYWFCRMVEGGCDPRYIARRIIRAASEDIGNADPRALTLALNAADVYERLGSPEGELALAQAVVYLACAAKSNAVYMAYKAALQDLPKYGSAEVPLYLRNAPTKLMKNLGYGKEYRYAHDEPHAYAAGEKYFPENMPERKYYQPTDRGLEKQIQEKLKFLKELDQKS